ncbi:MAG: hypothetical protein NOU37_01160 [Candidatus Brocadiales bacterium]|nr:hypothetical protein [Candidatus Bathyanammoxibius amoris]
MDIEIRWSSIVLIVLVLNVSFRVFGYQIISRADPGSKKNSCSGAHCCPLAWLR